MNNSFSPKYTDFNAHISRRHSHRFARTSDVDVLLRHLLQKRKTNKQIHEIHWWRFNEFILYIQDKFSLYFYINWAAFFSHKTNLWFTLEIIVAIDLKRLEHRFIAFYLYYFLKRRKTLYFLYNLYNVYSLDTYKNRT